MRLSASTSRREKQITAVPGSSANRSEGSSRQVNEVKRSSSMTLSGSCKYSAHCFTRGKMYFEPVKISLEAGAPNSA
ncbi:MAG: hypothetical protein CL920_18125 [Deltaproteobacteria bacterium]|nr:hypothetical protein [Deltaproteobacteria bacterium]